MMFTSHVLDQLTREQLMIDIASMPGGVDFDYARKRELRVIHALGIPEKLRQKQQVTLLRRRLLKSSAKIN